MSAWRRLDRPTCLRRVGNEGHPHASVSEHSGSPRVTWLRQLSDQPVSRAFPKRTPEEGAALFQGAERRNRLNN
eukprot:1616741-Pyramimonas_sp.AAC.1